jgi:hypothetical protein
VRHSKEGKLQEATAEVEYGSPFKEENSVSCQVFHTADQHVTFVEPKARIGFSLAVRTALRITTTPYVWVHQHDWTLETAVPLVELLDTMMNYDQHETTPIKYVNLPSIRLLKYAEQSDNMRFENFRKLTRQLKQEFEMTDENAQTVKISLTPLFFWHDKPHIASTAHYLQGVFPSRLATKRGTFIEDTIGQKARAQMKEDPKEWKKWATWLYYPDNGKQLCLRHLEGRTWRGNEADKVLIEEWKTAKERQMKE